MSKIWVVFCVMLSSVGCVNPVPAPTPKFYKNQLVMFNFTEDNLFFSKDCENVGRIERWHPGINAHTYLISLTCQSEPWMFPSKIYVKEGDIIREVMVK